MGDISRLIDDLPENAKLEKMLAECLKGFGGQGEEFRDKMRLYARQLASGELRVSEYVKCVQDLEYPIRQWINKQIIFKRRRLNKLLTQAVAFATGQLLEAIRSRLPPLP